MNRHRASERSDRATADSGEIPARALLLSLAALSVPAGAAALAPEWLSDDSALLLWMMPLLPAFLFAYYRGWRGAAVALAGGMAALAVAHIVFLTADVPPPGWRPMLGLVITYLLLAQGVAGLAELLHRERRRAQSLALTDPLTDLPNRRRAVDHLDRMFAAAVRGQDLAVVLFDLDRFKSLNDRFGHSVGDLVLQSFAELLTAETRRMDVSARFGGEEFLTILSPASEEEAKGFAERIRRGVHSLDLPCGRVTVSAGVAFYRDGTGSPDVLVAEADRALYRAKDAGRDRVEVAGLSVLEGWDTAPVDSVDAVPVAMPDAPPTSSWEPPKRPALVVVVDDDPEVERSVARMLIKLGHEVFDARGPDHVLDLFDRFGARIDLLITDVIMPGMNGLTLVEELGRRGHGVRVIYMSGYVHGEVTLPGIPGAVSGFMGKPIEMEALKHEVRRVLDASPHASLGGRSPGARDRRSRPTTPGAGTHGGFEERPGWETTILVLDDDHALRDAARHVLEVNGYRVLDAPTAHDALALLDAQDRSPDLILCDLVLPGLDGREAANLILARYPEARALYTSGYSLHETFVDDLERSGETFLPKPFEASELLEAVRRVEGKE